MNGKRNLEKDITPNLQDIVQTTMTLMPLEYHAYSSAYRTAASSESYLRNTRGQQRSVFVTASDPSDPSSLVYRPIGGKFAVVKPTDRSSVPYTVSVPARVVRDNMESEYTLRCFHDNPCEMESTARHPGTSMDSDVEDDEDIEEKYPAYQATEMRCPITTTAAEQLFCVAFAGPTGQISELRASYPLQLSARIDESRKCLVFDCFEYKPQCFDLDDKDLSKYIPTNRGIERWEQAFMQHNIDNNEDDYDDDDDDSFYNERVQRKDGHWPRGVQKYLIHNGLAGNFAFSRCLRFRFPLSNIIGIHLQADSSNGSDTDDNDDGGGGGAVLILEVSRPPPKDAFASRKVLSRWFKEHNFVLTKDWTPNAAASTATRIYLYGGLNELKQTAALMAKKCPAIALMLASKSCESNTLRDGSSIEYSASPGFSVLENVSYGDNGSTHIRTYEDLSAQDRSELRSDYRNSLCRRCGQIYFLGNTGFPCSGCGDGRMTRNLGPASPSVFSGRIENALEVFKAKCDRLDAETRGTELRRKVLGEKL